MTREEAISELTDIYTNVLESKDARTVRAFTMAVEALKQQTPKKPNICDGTKGLWHCPSCGNYYGRLKVSYCDRCGQAIDWEEKE